MVCQEPCPWAGRILSLNNWQSVKFHIHTAPRVMHASINSSESQGVTEGGYTRIFAVQSVIVAHLTIFHFKISDMNFLFKRESMEVQYARHYSNLLKLPIRLIWGSECQVVPCQCWRPLVSHSHHCRHHHTCAHIFSSHDIVK